MFDLKYELKAKLVEVIKFDYQFIKFPFTAFYLLIFAYHYVRKQNLDAVDRQ